MLYTPALSLTTVRAFSISAGLDASTETPGSTAPEASFTMPEILACASTVAGESAAQTKTIAIPSRCMFGLHGEVPARSLKESAPRDKIRHPGGRGYAGILPPF